LPRFFGGQQQKLAEGSDDKGHADTIMGMEVAGLAIPAHGKAVGATVSSRLHHPRHDVGIGESHNMAG
jgi:hypothetical protein